MDSFNNQWQSSPHVQIGIQNSQMDSLQIHKDSFEPKGRNRSNTWPLPSPESFEEPIDETDNNNQSCINQQLNG